MRFLEKELERFKKFGRIATMRYNYYREGRTVLITTGYASSLRRVGSAIVEKHLENTLENRKKYLYLSGYGTVEEWEREAQERSRTGKLPKHIYILKEFGWRD